jgi:acyl carrier protein
MTEAEIRERVLARLKEHAPEASGLTAEADIAAESGLDSVQIMDFVMDLEDEFDVTIPLDRIAEVRSVSELSAVVAGLRASAEGSGA